MSDQPGIIGIVKELQEMHEMCGRDMQGGSVLEPLIAYGQQMHLYFPAIAQAVLNQDEKLKDVEAILSQEIEVARISGNGLKLDAAIARALSRIRSL